jgi:hypothetical protein
MLILIPRIHPGHYQKVKLVGIESGGLWVESQEVINQTLQATGAPAAPKTLVIFFPYHERSFAFGRLDMLSLNEKAFGLEPRG